MVLIHFYLYTEYADFIQPRPSLPKSIYSQLITIHNCPLELFLSYFYHDLKGYYSTFLCLSVFLSYLQSFYFCKFYYLCYLYDKQQRPSFCVINVTHP